ncbi:MAG: hypothetical protein AAF512_19250, partial [Pseudomonadota bacterium]
NNLVVKDGANITSSAISATRVLAGDAGNIDIYVTDTLTLSGANPHGQNENGLGSGIYARALGTAEGSGHSGRILLSTNTLNLEDGGVISSETAGNVVGGDIEIQAETVRLSGDSSQLEQRLPVKAQIRYKAFLMSIGRACETVSNSRVTTSSIDGAGDAGAIELSAYSLKLTDGAAISSEAETAGGGRIKIGVTDRLYVNSNSAISASVGDGTGNGGSVQLSQKFIILDQGAVTAKAVGGDGGRINISADGLFRFPGSTIDASSSLGLDGIININAPDSDVEEHLVVLPTNFLEQGNLSAAACRIEAFDDRSRYLRQSRAGPHRSPDDWME